MGRSDRKVCGNSDAEKLLERARRAMADAALDADAIASRMKLAAYTASVFKVVGNDLNTRHTTLGIGDGDDAAVAISLLLRIGSQLVSASADLIEDGRKYAGCALIRQLVEVEYLAWAFETKDEDSTRWLRSTHDERRSFFTPAKLRAAAGDRFRSVDYGFHCELGGHPVPGATMLLDDEGAMAQLMLSDCLGHSGRIWDHIVGWARGDALGEPVLAKSDQMLKNYSAWKRIDRLTRLPMPPPEMPDDW